MDAIQELVANAQANGLDSLLIGGNALRLFGYLRNTLDVDFLIEVAEYPAWRAFLEGRGYRAFHATEAFAQFEFVDAPGILPVDLMIVDAATWEKLREPAQILAMGGLSVAVPRPEHLIALKLHAALSKHRSKPEQDWEDIRQLVRMRRLDPEDPLFREIILRYGNEAALRRIERFYDEAHD